MAVPYHTNVTVSLDLTVFYEHYGCSLLYFLLAIPNLRPQHQQKNRQRMKDRDTERSLYFRVYGYGYAKIMR